MSRPTANHRTSKGNGDGLMPEADSENRGGWREAVQQVDRTPGVARPPWPGRDHDRVRCETKTSRCIDLVAANHARHTAQPTKVAGQVVNERVVVIEKKNHG